MDKLLAAGTPQGRTGCTWTLGHSQGAAGTPETEAAALVNRASAFPVPRLR
jgi:hypothetical protein